MILCSTGWLPATDAAIGRIRISQNPLREKLYMDSQATSNIVMYNRNNFINKFIINNQFTIHLKSFFKELKDID
jgi:predicted thioredoxin/glutaredoxin